MRTPYRAVLDNPLYAYVALAIAGLVVTAFGLAWDALLHSHDHALAGHESVFSLSNPAHLTFALGLTLTAIGVLGAGVTVLGGRSLLRGRWAFGAAVAALGVGAGAAGAAVLSTGSSSAAGDHASGGPGKGHHAQGPKLPADARRGDAHALQQYPSLALATPAQRAAAQNLYDRSYTAAQRFRDPAAARAAGYVVNPSHVGKKGKPSLVLHARNPANAQDGRTVDPQRPETLVYLNPPDHHLTLIGVLYRMPRGQHGPDVAGPITRWHQHAHCNGAGGPGVDAARCGAARKARKPGADGTCPDGTQPQPGADMMHVWFTGDLRSAFAVHAPRDQLRAKYGAAVAAKRGKAGGGRPKGA